MIYPRIRPHLNFSPFPTIHKHPFFKNFLLSNVAHHVEKHFYGLLAVQKEFSLKYLVCSNCPQRKEQSGRHLQANFATSAIFNPKPPCSPIREWITPNIPKLCKTILKKPQSTLSHALLMSSLREKESNMELEWDIKWFSSLADTILFDFGDQSRLIFSQRAHLKKNLVSW